MEAEPPASPCCMAAAPGAGVGGHEERPAAVMVGTRVGVAGAPGLPALPGIACWGWADVGAGMPIPALDDAVTTVDDGPLAGAGVAAGGPPMPRA